MDVIRQWFQRYFSDPQAVLLAVLLILGFGVVLTMGSMLAPVLASLVIAYLLEGIVHAMERRGAPRFRVVLLVFFAFMAFLLFLLVGVVPLLWGQTAELVRELPNYISRGQAALLRLPEHYAFISEAQINELIDLLRKEITAQGQRILSLSLASIPSIITLLVYLILVPLLVFFFLKDKHRLVRWFTSFLPAERRLTNQVWHEVDLQLGNYVRGKFWEILIIGVTTFVVFSLMGLKYAILLGALVDRKSVV